MARKYVQPPSAALLLTLAAAMMLIGFGVTAQNWDAALRQGAYQPITSMAGPFLGCMGLAFALGPSSRSRELWRGYRLPLAQACLILGLVAGAANLMIISGWWPF